METKAPADAFAGVTISVVPSIEELAHLGQSAIVPNSVELAEAQLNNLVQLAPVDTKQVELFANALIHYAYLRGQDERVSRASLKLAELKLAQWKSKPGVVGLVDAVICYGRAAAMPETSRAAYLGAQKVLMCAKELPLMHQVNVALNIFSYGKKDVGSPLYGLGAYTLGDLHHGLANARGQLSDSVIAASYFARAEKSEIYRPMANRRLSEVLAVVEKSLSTHMAYDLAHAVEERVSKESPFYKRAAQALVKIYTQQGNTPVAEVYQAKLNKLAAMASTEVV